MQEVFEKIKEKIRKEIEDVIVKDTYTKGKNAGLRKAEIFIDEVAAKYNNGWIPCSGCADCEHKECENYGKV